METENDDHEKDVLLKIMIHKIEKKTENMKLQNQQEMVQNEQMRPQNLHFRLEIGDFSKKVIRNPDV